MVKKILYPFIFSCGVFALTSPFSFLFGTEDEPYRGTDKFQMLKKLEGTWVGGTFENPSEKITMAYRVLPEGNKIEEITSSNLAGRTRSVYTEYKRSFTFLHFDQYDFQTSFELRVATRNKLVFVIAAGSGIRLNNRHLHELSILFVNEREVIHRWSFFAEGRPSDERVIRLQRARPQAPKVEVVPQTQPQKTRKTPSPQQRQPQKSIQETIPVPKQPKETQKPGFFKKTFQFFMGDQEEISEKKVEKEKGRKESNERQEKLEKEKNKREKELRKQEEEILRQEEKEQSKDEPGFFKKTYNLFMGDDKEEGKEEIKKEERVEKISGRQEKVDDRENKKREKELRKQEKKRLKQEKKEQNKDKPGFFKRSYNVIMGGDNNGKEKSEEKSREEEGRKEKEEINREEKKRQAREKKKQKEERQKEKSQDQGGESTGMFRKIFDGIMGD